MRWQNWWLLFTVIWVVVAAIQVATILGTSEETDKAWRPVVFGLGVPAVLYVIGWLWATLRGRRIRGQGQDSDPRT